MFSVLTSSIGVNTITHYCGGQPVKTVLSFSFVDVSCGMPVSNSAEECSNGSDLQIKKKNCCENEKFRAALDGDVDVQKENTGTKQFINYDSNWNYLYTYFRNPSNIRSAFSRPPPSISIYIQNQNFRI